jgi:hypothetical protein
MMPKVTQVAESGGMPVSKVTPVAEKGETAEA